MDLPDVYCLFNRARGTELVSPDDLLLVLKCWEILHRIPVLEKKLKSFLCVAQGCRTVAEAWTPTYSPHIR